MYKLYINKQLVFSSIFEIEATKKWNELNNSSWGDQLTSNLFY